MTKVIVYSLLYLIIIKLFFSASRELGSILRVAPLVTYLLPHFEGCPTGHISLATNVKHHYQLEHRSKQPTSRQSPFDLLGDPRPHDRQAQWLQQPLSYLMLAWDGNC